MLAGLNRPVHRPLFGATCEMTNKVQQYFADVSSALFKRPAGLNPISSLDGLRCLLILSVMAAHALMWATSFVPNNGKIFDTIKNHPLQSLFSYHFLQFDGFFIISGFILTSQLLLRWRLLDGMSLKDMIVGRALGVLPSMAVIYAVLFFMKDIHSRNFIVSMLFMHNFLKSNYYPFSIAPSWLYSTDMQLWIVTFILLNIMHRLNILNGKTLVVLFISSCILPIFLLTPEHIEGLASLLKTPHIGSVITKDYALWMENRFRHVWHLTGGVIQGSTESFLSTFWFQGYTRLSAFLVGCITGYYFNLYHVAALEKQKDPAHHSQRTDAPWISSIAFSLSLLVILAPIFPWEFSPLIIPFTQLPSSAQSDQSSFLGFMWWRHIWTLAFGILLFSSVMPASHSFHAKRLKSFLSHPRWIPISRLSHGAFVIHFRLQLAIAEAIRPSYAPGYGWIFVLFLLSVIFSFAASFVLFMLIEVPVMKLRTAMAGPVAKNKPE